VAKRKQTSNRRKKSQKTSQTGLIEGLFSFGKSLQKDKETRDKTRRVVAWTALFVCILTLLACISYFYTGAADQSVIESGSVSRGEIRNWLGYLGAKLAELLIYKGFGIFGLLIPLYGILLSLVMLEDDYYFIVKRLLKYVAFTVLWGSVFLGYVVILVHSNPDTLPSNFDLGGGFGYFINMRFFAYVGKIGVAFLLLFALLIFAVINFNAEVRASKLVKKFSGITEVVRTQAKQIAKTSPVVQPKNRPADEHTSTPSTTDKSQKSSPPQSPTGACLHDGH